MVPDFVNEPLSDFSLETNRTAMQQALARIESEREKSYPLVIGGQRVESGQWIESTNPSTRASGWAGWPGRREQAEQALSAAECAMVEWSRFPAEERARVLLRVASRLRKRKFELAATMALEIGKTWVEADADTAEAIDFCEFYAREHAAPGRTKPGDGAQWRGERARLQSARGGGCDPSLELSGRYRDGLCR